MQVLTVQLPKLAEADAPPWQPTIFVVAGIVESTERTSETRKGLSLRTLEAGSKFTIQAARNVDPAPDSIRSSIELTMGEDENGDAGLPV